MKRNVGLGLVIGLLVVVGLAAAQLKPPKFADHEKGFQQIQYLESSEVLYNIRWDVNKVTRNGQTYYEYKGVGDNNRQGVERIDWTEESLMAQTPAGLQTQYWRKKSTGAEQMTWDLQFDWNSRKLKYKWTDALTGKNEEKTLSFEQNAIAGDAMNYLLRGFPFEKEVGYKIQGQIIGGDGSLIDGWIIHAGEEKLQTAFGTIDTYKLQLKPTGVLGLVAPKMWMWFTKAEPHIWLRFDGRDDGLTKPRTKNVLLEYSPREWVTP